MMVVNMPPRVFLYARIGKPYIFNVYTYVLHGWTWPRADMNVTTFTLLAQNCSMGMYNTF